MSHPSYGERVGRCADAMRAAGLDALLLTKPSNMFYLCGDGRLCAYALVTREGRVALGVPVTDLADVKSCARFDEIEGFENEVGMIHSIAHFFSRFGIATGTVGLEHTFLTQSMMAMLTHPHAKPAGVATRDCTAVMTGLRIVKEDGEVEAIAKAARVAGTGMRAAAAAARPGMTESQVAAVAESTMRNSGAEGLWRTYVCSGPRTAIAHGLPTLRVLQEGDLVMIDLHPIVSGYSADICRTICLGEPPREVRDAFDAYLRAQQATVARAGAGITMAELEGTLHGILEQAGHGAHVFGPPLHGVGIDFEEAPLPAGHAFFHGEKAPPPLAAGVVVAVGNCGLYAGSYGVRVEDTVVVGKSGPRVLTDAARSLSQRDVAV